MTVRALPSPASRALETIEAEPAEVLEVVQPEPGREWPELRLQGFSWHWSMRLKAWCMYPSELFAEAHNTSAIARHLEYLTLEHVKVSYSEYADVFIASREMQALIDRLSLTLPTR